MYKLSRAIEVCINMNEKAQDLIMKLIKFANKKNIQVRLLNFKSHKGYLKGNRIGIDAKFN